MSGGITAGDRLRRVLAVVPWIVARPGVQIREVAERFDIPEAALVADLEVVWMVGLPPYTPDALIEVAMEDGRVWIDYADFFARPLRLTPAQGLALLASSDALLSLPGTEPDGPLARALGKLAAVIGVDVDAALDIDLGRAAGDHLVAVRDALDRRVWIDLDYYSYGRDEQTHRRVAPLRLTANGGAWYLEAWCSLAEGERVFRLDRIAGLEVTDEPHDHSTAGDGDRTAFLADEALPRLTLDLAPEARWVADVYPCEAVVDRGDGTTRVTLAASSQAWVERLLLRLGQDAAVVADDSFHGADELRRDAARRVLARYER